MPADPRLQAAPPPATALLWDAFVDLWPVGTTPSEIQAYQCLHRITFSSWEIDTLRAMHRAAEAARDRATPNEEADT